jgi:MoaA/NifB/PqqE/SkfB family radical SAM enzyme
MCPRALVKDNGFMTTETMERIVEQVDSSLAWEFDVAGRGEPTIHPQFNEMAALMRKSGVPTCVVTTGVSFTDANIRACAEDFDIIRLSVSSIDKEAFDKVHIGLKFDRIWRNIRALGEAAAGHTIIHLTGGPVIYDSLPRTVEHLRELGFRRFKLLSLWNRGGAYDSNEDRDRRKQLMAELDIPPSENEAWTGDGKVKFFANLALGKLQNRRYCPIGDSSVSISYRGDILGCFQDFGHTSNVGNIHKDKIRDIVAKRVTEVGQMKVCQGCDAHKVTLFRPNLLRRSSGAAGQA